MQLAREAGEYRKRPAAPLPPARQREEPAAKQLAREVLLGDAGITSRPARAKLGEVGKHDVGEHGLEREGGEQPVERLVRATGVHGVELRGQLAFGRSESR